MNIYYTLHRQLCQAINAVYPVARQTAVIFVCHLLQKLCIPNSTDFNVCIKRLLDSAAEVIICLDFSKLPSRSPYLLLLLEFGNWSHLVVHSFRQVIDHSSTAPLSQTIADHHFWTKLLDRSRTQKSHIHLDRLQCLEIIP